MLHVRTATHDDIPGLTELLLISLQTFDPIDYGHQPLRAATGLPLGLSSYMIADGTCILAETHGEIAACVGWSYRRAQGSFPAFPGERAATPLNPATDPARLQALYIHPRWARGGLARRLLRACEQAVRQAGFRQLELLATPIGESFYAACGFACLDRVDIRLSDKLTVATLRMRKGLAPATVRTPAPLADAGSTTHRHDDTSIPRLVPPPFALTGAAGQALDYSPL